MRSAYLDRPKGRFVLLGALVASLASGRVHAVDVKIAAVAATVRDSGEVSAVLGDPRGFCCHNRIGARSHPARGGAALAGHRRRPWARRR